MDNSTSYKSALNLKIIGSFFSLLTLFACHSTEPRLPESPQEFCGTIQAEAKTTLSEQLSGVSQKMQSKTGVYVLEQGAEAMFSRAWLSSHAEQTIDVQYFIFSADNIGLIAIDYLVRAAERGIKVRILVDDIMVDAKGDELLMLDAHENLSIKIYNPMANVGKNIIEKMVNITTDFHGFNQRMHNKTFTVDGKVAITGGRNVADEYFGYDHEYNFRDRDVLLIGGVSTDIQKSFNQFWDDKLSVPVNKLVKIKGSPVSSPTFAALHQYACNPDNFLPQIREQIQNMPEAFNYIQETGKLHWLDEIEYISDAPGKNNQNEFLGGSGISTERLITLVQKAEKSVIIQTPYLITTDLGKNIFKQLIDKGVEVKILTNSLASNDNLEAFSGYQRDRDALLKTGVRIFEFKPDAQVRKKVMSSELQQKLDHIPVFGLHAKSMVIDDNITVIGTFNLDPRSANLNTESVTIIPSAEIAKSVKQGMLTEMNPENAWETTLDWNPDGEVSKIKQLRVKSRIVVPKNIL